MVYWPLELEVGVMKKAHIVYRACWEAAVPAG